MPQESKGKESKGDMTVEEAGRKGGERTSETHGEEFYQEIGHKGGQAVQEQTKKYEEIQKE